MRQGQCCCCCTSRLVTTTTTMPALRHCYVTLLSISAVSHMYFYHCFNPACPVSIHVYSLFYLAVVLLMALMSSPPCAVGLSSFIRFAMLSYDPPPRL